MNSIDSIEKFELIDPKTINEELVTVLGPSASSYTTVTRWVENFCQEREDINDHP